jgi:uncharacterized membrane protein
MNPLLTVRGAITTGFVAAVVLSLLISPTSFGELSLARWLHIVSGVLWIGLLYYFNFVQIPALAAAAEDKGGPGGAAITRYVAPRALIWFRWAALATWFTGAWYLGRSGNFTGAFTLGLAGDGVNYYQLIIGIGAWLGTIMLFNVWALIWPSQKKVLGLAGDGVNYYQLIIGIGAWLGTIMLFNVWALIWPSQRKVLGLVAASDEEKTRARKVAMLASRINVVLSIPMLLCMGSATHGLPL